MSQIVATNGTTVVPVPLDIVSFREAELVFSEMGLPIGEAISLFIAQTLNRGELPFRVKMKQPNRRLISAIAEAEQIISDPNAPTFSSLEDLWADLDSDA